MLVFWQNLGCNKEVRMSRRRYTAEQIIGMLRRWSWDFPIEKRKKGSALDKGLLALTDRVKSLKLTRDNA